MSKTLVQKQFGAHAAAYVTSPVHAKGASLERVIELVRPQKHWRALDVATAAGHMALALAPHVAHVTASDLTDEMLIEAAKLARDRSADNFETVKADAEHLPFTDATFDLVTCRIAAHHFPDVPRFVAETSRVLKPGGTFALVDNISPGTDTEPGFGKAEVENTASTYNAFEKLRDPSHGRCLTLQEWTGLLAKADFDIAETELLAKEMAFRPWAERMNCDAETVRQLETMLGEAKPALSAFLKPRTDVNGALMFTLTEAVIVTRKTSIGKGPRRSQLPLPPTAVVKTYRPKRGSHHGRS